MIIRHPRRGVAAIWALVVMALLSGFSLAAIGRFASARNQLEMTRARTQAEWLARSGHEIAIARLLAQGEAFTGEKLNPIRNGEIIVSVRKDPADKTVFFVESEGRYKSSIGSSVTKSTRRSFKRIDGPSGVRIEPRAK